MSEVQKRQQAKKLFRYAIDEEKRMQESEKMHFRRFNRMRFNTFNRINLLKLMRVKSPIIFGLVVGIAAEYTLNFYDNPAPAH